VYLGSFARQLLNVVKHLCATGVDCRQGKEREYQQSSQKDTGIMCDKLTLAEKDGLELVVH